MTIFANGWVVYALCGALAASLGTIFAKIGLQGVDSNIVTTVRGVFMALIVTVVTLFLSKNITLTALAEIQPKTWLFVFLSALGGAVSWLLFFYALSIGPAQGVTVVDKLSIIITIVLAGLFLQESLTFKTILGSFLILLGTLLVALPSDAWRAVMKFFS
jgi:bacterial/archaeal transporter family protein